MKCFWGWIQLKKQRPGPDLRGESRVHHCQQVRIQVRAHREAEHFQEKSQTLWLDLPPLRHWCTAPRLESCCFTVTSRADWDTSTALVHGSYKGKHLGPATTSSTFLSCLLTALEKGHHVDRESLIHFTDISWIKHCKHLDFFRVPLMQSSQSLTNIIYYSNHAFKTYLYHHATSGFSCCTYTLTTWLCFRQSFHFYTHFAHFLWALLSTRGSNGVC